MGGGGRWAVGRGGGRRFGLVLGVQGVGDHARACCYWITLLVRKALCPLAILALSIGPRACDTEGQCGGVGRRQAMPPSHRG
eukprot:11330-Prymnesium_polylepis.1